MGEDKSVFLQWYNEHEDTVFNNTRAEIAVSRPLNPKPYTLHPKPKSLALNLEPWFAGVSCLNPEP